MDLKEAKIVGSTDQFVFISVPRKGPKVSNKEVILVEEETFKFVNDWLIMYPPKVSKDYWEISGHERLRDLILKINPKLKSSEVSNSLSALGF